MNHLTQVKCQKADLTEATVWDAACILYFTFLFDTVRVVKLLWSLYHVVAVSSAVRWKSAPKWQWNMNVFFLLLFCFLSLCSLMKNFKYATGFLFPSVFSPRLLSSVWPCQWYYESVSNIMTQVKSSFFSSLRPLIFSPEQVCSSCVIVGFKCGTFAQVVKSQNKTWKDPQWFHD